MKYGRIVHIVIAVAIVVFSLGGAHALAGDAAGSWPEFHGPDRDNISKETGLLKKWPADGPKLIWKFSKLGTGYALVSVADGLIFTSGEVAGKQMVVALTLEGKPAWRTPNGESWTGAYPGARTTPTYRDGVVYQMNAHGRLAAFQAKTGKEIWAVELAKRFDVDPIRWAMAENVVVEGDTVLCAPGGRKGRVAALDKATGKTVWANTEFEERPAYCSPIVAEHKGVRQMITLMAASIVSVDVKTGKLLWRREHATKEDQNIVTPIYHDGCVYASSGHSTGGRLMRIADDSRSVKDVWLSSDQDNCHGGVILYEGHFYGSGCRLYRKGLVCVELAGGKTVWNEPKMSKVSMAYADGMLYCLDDKGKLSLLKADPAGCKIAGQFELPRKGKTKTLSHPVICGGRLYVRHWDELFVYDIRAGK